MKQAILSACDINAFTDAKEVQDEYAVLDRAGADSPRYAR